MTTLQIVLLSIISAVALTSVVFMVLFLIEITVSHKEKEEEVEVKSIFSSENYVKETRKEENVDAMLAKLDENNVNIPVMSENEQNIENFALKDILQKINRG